MGMMTVMTRGLTGLFIKLGADCRMCLPLVALSEITQDKLTFTFQSPRDKSPDQGDQVSLESLNIELSILSGVVETWAWTAEWSQGKWYLWLWIPAALLWLVAGSAKI